MPDKSPSTILAGDESSTDSGAALTVVGVGASAGGLEAFTALLRALPARPNLTLVLVQHLDPTHQSMLPELLARTTKMPVLEATDGLRWEVDHVYVMPHNVAISIRDGALCLTPRQGTPPHPIDEFFQSLAEQRALRAVGVVLSGSGSDGTRGLRALKLAGGITFAQDEATARFDAMPRSAIAAGFVDFVLPPERIAEELIRIGGQATWLHQRNEASGSSDVREQMGRVLERLRLASGVDFTQYKRSTIERRVLRRVVLRASGNLEEYLGLLDREPTEVDALYRDMLINVTGFFREPEAFEALSEKLFPALLEGHGPDEPIRVWVPGCSTGEEVYSIGIALDEFLRAASPRRRFQIFGTDLSESMIERARAGIYPDSISSEVAPARLADYFENVDGHYQIRTVVRDCCIFARHDLTRDPPFSHLHLISCRNVFIYLGPALQKRVLPIFHYALNSNGFLILGRSESLPAESELFEAWDRPRRFYRKKPGRPSLPPHMSVEGPLRRSSGVAEVTAPAGLDVVRQADRILLNEYSPPCLILDTDLQVVQFRGDVGPFLEPFSGSASFDVSRLVHPRLASRVRKAVERARAGEPVVTDRARTRGGAEVGLRVVPLGPAEPRHFLVVLQGDEQPAPVRGRAHVGSIDEKDSEIQALAEELASTREQLQGVMEAQQAATEEILSSNEELQSTNEEIQTAKEELQSANEELHTLNEELQVRIKEAVQSYSDLEAVLASANIPVVMLSDDLHIRRITPMAEAVLNLIPGDVGRCINDIRVNLQIEDLGSFLAEAIATGSPREREVQDAQGRWRLLRVRPYRGRDERTRGIVMAVLDVHEVKLATQRREAAEGRRRIDAILDSMTDAFYALDLDWRVLHVNKKAADLLGREGTSLLGKVLWDEVPSLAGTKLESELRRGQREQVTVAFEFHPMAEALHEVRAYASAAGMTVYFRDLTSRRNIERLATQATKLRRSNEELERFAYVVAHDLQEPLRTIDSFTQLLVRRFAKEGQEAVDLARFVSGGVERMRALLRDLLAYSKVELGGGRGPADVDCSRALSDALADLTAAIESTGARITSDALPVVRGDRTQLTQVFRNLVGNAIKFSGPRTPEIAVTCEDPGHHWLFSVRDHGIGIRASDREAIFLLFKQLHASEEYEGTGLGLAITKKIIEQHGGTIWVESEPGVGSVFRFTLPKKD